MSKMIISGDQSKVTINPEYLVYVEIDKVGRLVERTYCLKSGYQTELDKILDDDVYRNQQRLKRKY